MIYISNSSLSMSLYIMCCFHNILLAHNKKSSLYPIPLNIKMSVTNAQTNKCNNKQILRTNRSI